MKITPITSWTEDELKHFWEKVSLAGQDECWLWTGAIDKWLYGKFVIRVDGNKKQVLATRFSYTVTKGIIPDEQFVLHSCDNPTCVNPNHLYAGTHQENMEDMKSKGRANSKLKADDVKEIIKLRYSGFSFQDIANRFRVSVGCISNIFSGRTWSWLTREYFLN